jgi:hypothetical protein
MEDRASRILYFLLFYLGWIGILWTAYAFCLNAYNKTMDVFTETPSFLILLCVSLMSIATALILEQASHKPK